MTTIYNFDNRLKAILMEALEMIEVSFKTKVINSISLRHNDAHRFLNDSLFITEPAFNNVIRVIKK
ncbi:MAG: Abi family protein [Candidatus Peribacteria bacterium]|nr:Abi family protein [Candidatus Peribacteria bacterium]